MPDLDPTEYFKRELRAEKRANKNAAQIFTRACQTSDVETFYAAVDQLNGTVDGWLAAMRKVIRDVRTVTPEIQAAFRQVWIKSNMLSLKVGDHRALCNATRLLLPKYSGPAVRLFRGTGAAERRRRIYGLSWSADFETAERFALDRRVWDGGSVLLETLAVPEAIISEIDYPQPFTQKEIEKLKREHPGITIEEFHKEREYVVDRRCLNAVSVVRRYKQSHQVPVPPSLPPSGN